ncbi:MAG: transcription-repair coupling factor [Gammaproteobacteria bacterium]|nr:transcription-repair coupling factor [Gammaproteobacteria bacterium]
MPSTDIRQTVLPSAPGVRVAWGALHGSADALAIANGHRHAADRAWLVVCASPAEADRMAARLAFYHRAPEQVRLFPDAETLPYDSFSPHPDLISERIRRLAELARGDTAMLVVSAATLLARLPPAAYVARSLSLHPGQQLDSVALRRQLETAGYSHVSQVMEHGEFAVRGSLIDLFPMGESTPVRIDLFDDVIDTLKRFDPESQRSTETLEALEILPAREFPLDEAGIRGFRQRFRARFEGDPARTLIYREVSAGNAPGGIEYYLPLFFDDTASLLDYLPADSIVCMPGDMEALLEAQWQQACERHEQMSVDPERPLLAPAEALWAPGPLLARLRDEHRGIELSRNEYPDGDGSRVVNYATSLPPAVAFDQRAEQPAARLAGFLNDFDGRVLIAAESAGRRELILDVLKGRDFTVTACRGWAEFLDRSPALGITVAPLDSGLMLPEAGLAVIAEEQLFGDRVRATRERRRAERDPATLIRDLRDLREGTPVVHQDHGVGRFIGLMTLEVGNASQEFLTLEYQNNDRLYVPVQSLELISRYTGSSPESAPLHRLGGEQWARARRKAAEKIRDVAAELLDVHARRAARIGHGFSIAEADYRAFAAAFPFEETDDQLTTIEQVINDMRAPQPMDRVVCGDVGFGKTEVALRASFVAVQDGRQVAVLVPTTLLAQQHFRTFSDRFADWPIRVEMLSRFRTGKQVNQVLRDLADGRVDIVVGTHKLLAESVKFARLGLVIVDEEHRFGVRHKEALKRMRSEVDLLTLTATPIPRTLNMALGGLRDLSLITTPPSDRLGVKTFVTQWSHAVIREACLREIKRGGQVYFVHNSIETIERVADELETLLPEARLRVAHGQMRERDLEQIMLDFYHRRFNVLLCTTIIESGIDVPTANTILINRADRFGLAQLHQLRGRVGRSHHRAYAYLLAPPPAALTADAVKRLEAIESLEDLGAGFALASHDLEIRGAGELLGDEQSGQIHEIGFTMYMDLLERAVADLKAGREPALDQPLFHGTEVDLGVAALLPEDYLPDVHQRLILYKRISACTDDAALDELQVEMIDRFGLLPPAAKHLVQVARLKHRASPLGLRKLEVGAEGGRLKFHADTRVDPMTLVGLVQREPKVFSLDGGELLRFRASLPEAADRFDFACRLLERLRPDANMVRSA